MATESVSVFYPSSSRSLSLSPQLQSRGKPKTRTGEDDPWSLQKSTGPAGAAATCATAEAAASMPPRPTWLERTGEGERTTPTLTTSTASSHAVVSGLEPNRRGRCQHGQARQPFGCCSHCHRHPRACRGGSVAWPWQLALARSTYTWQQSCHMPHKCTCSLEPAHGTVDNVFLQRRHG